jgi:hypothetical protein
VNIYKRLSQIAEIEFSDIVEMAHTNRRSTAISDTPARLKQAIRADRRHRTAPGFNRCD